MNHTRQVSQVVVSRQTRKIRSAVLKPIAATLLATGMASPVYAIDTAWFGGNGNWNTAANWSLGIPGAGDVAIVNSGTVSLGFDTGIQGLTQGGGLITGSGMLTVTGTATLDGGTHDGAGISQFNGDVIMAGEGTRSLTHGRTMNTAATTTWSGNTVAGGNRIDFNTGGVINNSGTWNDSNTFSSSVALGGGVGGKAFVNSGTYNKLGNSTTEIYAGFYNAGVVNVNAGRLSLLGHGAVNSSSSGTFHIESGATLSFGNGLASEGGGLATLDNATFTGSGRLLINGEIGGIVDVRMIGSHQHAGQLVIDTGTLDNDGSLQVASLDQNGGTLSGSGTMTVTGTATLDGGTQNGAGGISQFNGEVRMIGDNSRTVAQTRTMNTAATTTWAGNTMAGGNSIAIRDGATIHNTGTWNDANAFDSAIDNLGGTGIKTFSNAGTYNKTGDATTTIESIFSNTGITNVVAGTIHVATAFTNQGKIETASGATFLGSHATFVNAGILAGNGTYATHANGDIVNRSAIDPGDVNEIGKLSFSGDLDLDEATPGVLNIELASLTDFDAIDISGDVTLGGELAIFSVAGYNPTLGDSFVIATFGGVQVGGLVFDTVTWQGFDPNVAFEVVYNTDNVTLNVAAVPEPETYAMLLAGLGLVGIAARRRSKTEP